MELAKGSSIDRALNHDDMQAARELEDEIERRGLREVYVAEMVASMPHAGKYELCWLMLRATPEQRARAFLKATNVQSDD